MELEMEREASGGVRKVDVQVVSVVERVRD